MLKFLKAISPIWITHFEFDNGASVDSITSSLQKTVKKLEYHSAKHVAFSDSKAQRSNDLYLESMNHAEEAHKARSVAGKIGALLS